MSKLIVESKFVIGGVVNVSKFFSEKPLFGVSILSEEGSDD